MRSNRLLLISIISTLIVLTITAVFFIVVDFVTVPPATKGKILTTRGYLPEVHEPSKMMLFPRQELVLLETHTATYTEKVKIILADRLTLFADVKFRGRIAGEDEVINSMFNDIIPGKDKKVSFLEVYSVYGQMAVRNKTREVISTYSAEEVHKNYALLSVQIGEALVKALKNTPLEISDVALGDIQYPEVVTAAIEQAEKTRLAITKQQAQAKIDMTKKDNERLLAEAQYQIDITKAKAVRDANLIIGEGITPELLDLKRIEALLEMAANESAVFMPVEAMSSVGAQVKMFNDN